MDALRILSLRSFLVSLGGVALAGCASLGEESPVEVMLSNLAPGQGGGVGDAALNFVIRLENTSPESITVDGGAYKIYLNDIYVGQGLSNQTVEIARLSSTTITVPVHVSTVRLVGSLYSVLKSNQVSYRLEASVYVKRGGGSKKFRATREGTVNFAEVQNKLGGAGAR